METSKIQLWNRTTEAIYKNVMLYSIAGIAAAVFNMVFLGFLVDICNVLVVAGFIAYFIRLKDLGALAEEADALAIKKLINGVLLYILALMLSHIFDPIGGILSAIAIVASCVFMLLGYSALKKSATFPGAAGMNLLFISMIIGIVGGVLDIIPGIGVYLGGVCYIVEFVLVLLGWKKVAEPVVE